MSGQPLRRSITYSQNFLKSSRLVDRLLDGSSIGPGDLVYEIGPGKGIITDRLALRCAAVVAVEKDPGLTATLRRRYANRPGVRIDGADFLECPLPRQPYKVFANLPFRDTAAILTRLTGQVPAPVDCYVVVQREAAERYLGEPRETLCSVLLKPRFEPSIIHRFRRSDFDPAPGVDVVLLRLNKRGPPLLMGREAKRFQEFVTFAFTAWKPSLAASLQSIFGNRHVSRLGKELHIDLGKPPSHVYFEQWLALFHALNSTDQRRLAQCVSGAEPRLRRVQRGLQKRHRTPSAMARSGMGRERQQMPEPGNQTTKKEHA